MPPRQSWSNLRTGLIALVVIIGAAVGILLFAGVGQIRGDTVRVYVVSDQANGIIKGSEVWVAGQKSGLVDAVEFLPPSTDSTAKVVIVTTVRAEEAKQLRRDSRVSVRPGTSLIGAVVVYLAPGSASSAPIRSGDTLRGAIQADFEVASAKLGKAAEQVGPLMADTRQIISSLKSSRSSIGAFMHEGMGAGGEVGRLRRTLVAVNTKAGVPRAGLSATMRAAKSALARVDSLKTLVASDRTSLGRFRRDSTLAIEVGRARDDVAALTAKFTSVEGTTGRFLGDSAIARNLAGAQQEMTALFADIKQRPLRYIRF